MIRVTVQYRNEANSRFDWSYYEATHLPMVAEGMGARLIRSEVYRGIAGIGGAAAPFHCTAHMFFESVDAFQQAFSATADRILSDIPHYTSVEPVITIEQAL